jgi:predicted NBD/HSP70 family sugar kinase
VRKGNRDLMREINRNLVLNLIKRRGPVSRVELARLSGLSPATISGIIGDFIRSGLVQEMGQGQSTGGRRPVMLRLNHKAGFVVGAKLMEHAIVTAVTDLDANVLHHQLWPLEVGAGQAADPGRLIDRLILAIERTIVHQGVARAQLLGIGVGMAGLVDAVKGVSRYSPFFGWQDVQIAAPLQEHFQLPVYLENDVNTLTIAEQWFGYGQGVEHFVVVTVGRGIGAGIVLNGQFYRGALGGAGEVGHMKLQPRGPRCDCGAHGCLEALASDTAILRQAKEAVAAGRATALAEVEALTLEAVRQAAEGGDRLARRLLAEAGRWLGLGIANLVNLLNPQLVIVGGEGVRAGEMRLAPMRAAISENAFRGLADQLDIVIEPSGDVTWARGAACLVLGELFKSPMHSARAGGWVTNMA